MKGQDEIKKALSLCPGDSLECEQDGCPYWDIRLCVPELHIDALELLKEQEAKPLRCKECSYHRNDGWCNEHGREVKESDYCSFGAWEGR